ncbi:universal stress protein [Natribacillus halophilus]|uniref:Nucleotide-binding universal stress protein, UspA family n=1 Tax=Natribacillus halophilus TaxID=549003 RepID=A0A1G8NVZ0_9BACI|nr:universal stress protein [Natribacillus halophilus]SDI83690.1 Nucleotide-binding universal stress protein, UspA family [Natribacillus halophilus]
MSHAPNTIVVAVDDRPEGQLARQKAMDMAVQHNAQLILVHVINLNLHHYIDRTNITFRSNLAAKRRQMLVDYQHMCYQEGGFYPKAELAFGQPEKILATDIMEKYDPQLIIVGTRRKKGIRQWLKGQNDRRLSRRVPCDVLTVQAEKH